MSILMPSMRLRIDRVVLFALTLRVADADCKTKWSVISDRCTLGANANCTNDCQADIDAVKNGCNVGDVKTEAMGITTNYNTYSIYAEMHSTASKCDLSYNANACDLAINDLMTAGTSMGNVCKPADNTVCSNACKTKIETLNTACPGNCFVPDCCMLAGTGELQKWSKQAANMIFGVGTTMEFTLSTACKKLITVPHEDSVRTAANPPTCGGGGANTGGTTATTTGGATTESSTSSGAGGKCFGGVLLATLLAPLLSA